MRRVVGIDVGGTFTDLLLYETGAGGERVRLAKIPTTAANQAAGSATPPPPAKEEPKKDKEKKGIFQRLWRVFK